MSLMYTGSTMQACPGLAAVLSLLPKANIYHCNRTEHFIGLCSCQPMRMDLKIKFMQPEIHAMMK